MQSAVTMSAGHPNPVPAFDPNRPPQSQSQSQATQPHPASGGAAPQAQPNGNGVGSATGQTFHSTDTSPSTNQTLQTPPHFPGVTYPSLSHSYAGPNGPMPGPSDQGGYQPYGPGSWMMPPNFYPPQHLHQSQPQQQQHHQQNFQRPYPNHGNSRHFGGGPGGRYNNQNQGQNYNRFPMGQPGYGPNPYYTHPQMYPQMGGPGPGTMQNGYPSGGVANGGYPMDGTAPFYMRSPGYAQQQPPSSLQANLGQSPNQNYPSTESIDASPQFAKGQPNGTESSGVSESGPSDAPPYHQPPQPPPIPPNGSNGPKDGPNGVNDPYRSGPSPFLPNGRAPTPPPPNQPQPNYQSLYPPGHPYAYGGGIGYSPYMHPQGMYGNYPYDPNMNMSPQQFPPPNFGTPSQHNYRHLNGAAGGPSGPGSSNVSTVSDGSAGPRGKGLNPAAAGFTFVPAQQRAREVIPVIANEQQRAQPNVTPKVTPTPFSETTRQSQQLPASDQVPNGHAVPTWPGAGQSGSQQAGPADESSQDMGLRLEHMTLSGDTSGTTSADLSASVSTTASASASASASVATQSTPATSMSPKTPKSTISTSIRTPRAVSDSLPAISSVIANSAPESPQVSSAQPYGSTSTSTSTAPDAQLNFVGPTLSGYTSPNMGSLSAAVPLTPSIAQTLTSAPSTSSVSSTPSASAAAVSGSGSGSGSRTVKSKAVGKSTAVEPLKLVTGRRGAVQVGGIVYSTDLKGHIPSSVKTEQVQEREDGKATTGRKTRTRSRPLKLATVFNVGVRSSRKRKAPSVLVNASSLTFGSVDAAELPPSSSAPTTGTSKPSTSTQAAAPVPTPTPVPRSKPSSWAALLKPEGASSTTTSTSTRNVSPAATATPLSPMSDAATGILPVTPGLAVPVPETTTSPSASPSAGSSAVPAEQHTQPARSAQKAQGTSAGPSRATFNYAAAAAAGATMTPQQELSRLLSEGISGKGKGRDVKGTLPRGLINTGNMCFANTILQVLVYCPPFADLLEELGKRLKADLARKTPLLEAMIIFLREFTAQPGSNPPPPSGTSTPRSGSDGKGKERDSRKDAFVPENVYDAMKENKRFDSMRRGYQEDAEEYLGFFLNTLHEELLYILSRTQTTPRQPRPQVNGTSTSATSTSPERSIQRPVSPGPEDDAEPWMEVGKKQKVNVVRSTETRETAVSRLFGGTLRSVLHIPGSKDSVTLEPYQPLQLDVDSPHTLLSITDALRQLSAPETVPGVWSPSRGSNVDATKQVYIESFPPALILHLKRFVFDAQEMSVVKRFRPVAYGTELVIPQEIISPGRRSPTPVKYRLFGVVYHHGNSASGGHYTVSVSRQDGAGWIHFDDDLVSTIPVEQVVVSPEEAKDGRAGLVGAGGREKCAYLLFYLRMRA